MPKAVLDTTVLVSAFLNPDPDGISFQIIRLADQGRFDCCISEEILAETTATLTKHARLRRRYRYSDIAVNEFCAAARAYATVFAAVPAVRIVRDPKDDMVLGCALAAGADYLVTRDKDLLSLVEYAGIKIVTTEGFRAVLRQIDVAPSEC